MELYDQETGSEELEAPQVIKAINKGDVHRICSGQVVLNLAIAVKELVENALDAGATIIEIRLKDHGKDSIEVSDNGSGVQEENFSGLTLKYHTSKLNDFSDLLTVSTYGFRGEALSSLCSLSELSVLTRHKSVDFGSKICYDHMGQIISITPNARQIGTTVTLLNLFSTLPVRQKEFHRNLKRDFNKMVQILYAYCLVCENIKITCSNQTSSGKSLVVSTQGATLRDNIASIFGIKQLQTILEIKPQFPNSSKDNLKKSFYNNLKKSSQTIPDSNKVDDVVSEEELELSEDSSNDATQPNEIPDLPDSQNFSFDLVLSQKSNSKKKSKLPFDFQGYISSCAHGSGRSTTDRQFFYINSRPCEPKKVMKVCNEIYKQFNPNQYPFVFLNISLKKSTVDVNVTPDKRKVFFDKEKYLLDILKESINVVFENIPSTMKSNNQNLSLSRVKSDEKEKANTSNPRIFSSFLSQFSSKSEIVEDSSPKHNNMAKRKSTTMDDFMIVSKIPKIKDCDDLDPNNLPQNSSNEPKEETVFLGFSDENDIRQSQIVTLEDVLSDSKVKKINKTSPKKSVSPKNQTLIDPFNLLSERVKYYIPDEELNQSEESDLPSMETSEPGDNIVDIIDEPETEKPSSSKSSCSIVVDNTTTSNIFGRKSNEINISLEEIKKKMIEASSIETITNKNMEKVKFRSEINPKNNQQCEDELQKSISKDSFSEMLIIGQFNLGFIITQLGHDLFIIDQHATDEKYNFETLQKSTVLSSQKLVVPQNLELTGVNERILIDSLEIFRKNGFDFIIDENEPPTKRVRLSSIPYSKNWMFGKEDIDELLFMLKDAPNELCRPSRVRAMFASRACRKSVMIGTALSKADMRKLVEHMGLIEQPWNCPHGRPTIRHLVNIGLIKDIE